MSDHEKEIENLKLQIDILRAERDEARRDVCDMMHMTGFLSGDFADSKGWDCFKDGFKEFSDTVKDFRNIYYAHSDKVTAERDEARREVCELKSYNFAHKITPKAYAELRKWDCFNDKTEADTNNTLFRTTDGE